MSLYTLVFFGVFVSGVRRWDLACPCGNLTIEERIKMAPFVALVHINGIEYDPNGRYNASATVKLGVKGTEMQEQIKIVNIVRDVDGECHTLLPNNDYITFMRAISSNEYMLINVDQHEFDPNDKETVDRISLTPNVSVAEIDYVHDSISVKEHSKEIAQRRDTLSTKERIKRIFQRFQNSTSLMWTSDANRRVPNIPYGMLMIIFMMI